MVDAVQKLAIRQGYLALQLYNLLGKSDLESMGGQWPDNTVDCVLYFGFQPTPQSVS